MRRHIERGLRSADGYTEKELPELANLSSEIASRRSSR